MKRNSREIFQKDMSKLFYLRGINGFLRSDRIWKLKEKPRCFRDSDLYRFMSRWNRDMEWKFWLTLKVENVK